MKIIMHLIQNNPSVTAKEMEKATGLTRRRVEYNLSNLKSRGRIKREGSTNGGQ